MRKVLASGSFWVFSVFGLYYVLTFFGASSDVPTFEVRSAEPQSESFGMAIAETHRVVVQF